MPLFKLAGIARIKILRSRRIVQRVGASADGKLLPWVWPRLPRVADRAGDRDLINSTTWTVGKERLSSIWINLALALPGYSPDSGCLLISGESRSIGIGDWN
jgi:hypothetical protein